jgi:hypothetical protein
MLAWIVGAVMSLVFLSGITGMIPEPAHSIEHHTADNASESDEWQEYHALAYSEYVDTFTALYEGLEVRWAKNGRLMIRNGDSGPYKFVKRAA